jgi:flavodoxin
MKKNIVVIYKSKTGYAKKYAEWISEELQCDLKENDKLKVDIISNYDTIIYGGGLYAVGINGIKLLKDNFEKLKDKNLIVYATGASPEKEEDINKVWEMNFSEEQNKIIKKFYLRGGFDYSKLSVGNKILMSMLKSKLQREKNPDEDAVGMLNAYDRPVDYTDRENIKGLVDYAKSL